MTQTTVRLIKGGKKYEILVDLDEALKVRKDLPDANLGAAVLTEAVFHNLKSGEHVSTDSLEIDFGTSDFSKVCEKIIKNGEVVLPTDYVNKIHDAKYKKVVDFLHKNGISPQGTPYTPDRIMSVLKEANVVVKNESMDKQIQEIIEKIQKIIPIKIEMKKIKILVPSQYTGKAYGVLNEYKVDEEWQSNGDLEIIVNVPAGILMDFYDKLNGITHGSALAEEIKN